MFNDEKELQIFIDYAKQDSLSLLNALIKAQQIYWANYNVDISTIWSTSTLSLKIFRLNFLNKIIPSLTQAQDHYIRKGYFGGATDHYKLYGENLYYYDINSLYPSVMLKVMPLNHIQYHNSIKKENFNNFFGFCLVEIECPKNMNIPLLPYRNMNNEVIYPTGIWKGVYFSEILKSVIKHGYKVKPINGHEFSKAYLFTNYVHHFYDIKKNAIGPTRFIAKMHLNQLYGYFGRSQELIMTKNVNREELEEILQTRIVETIITIKNGSYVALMKGNLNHELIHQLNYTLDLTDYKKFERNVKTNVAIAAAVTAYAQIEMIKYKTLPGYDVYYSDTDSIFFNKPLPKKNGG